MMTAFHSGEPVDRSAAVRAGSQYWFTGTLRKGNECKFSFTAKYEANTTIQWNQACAERP